MTAAQLRIPKRALQHPLVQAERLHPEPGHDQQHVIRPQRGHGPAQQAVDEHVVLLQHAPVAPDLVRRYVPEVLRLRVAHELVAHGIEPAQIKRKEGRVECGTQRSSGAQRAHVRSQGLAHQIATPVDLAFRRL